MITGLKITFLLMVFIQQPVTFEASQYKEVLRLTTKFYGAQRCGDNHNWLLTENPYGNKCHMQDGQALQDDFDLTGGWHDAGDYLKFSLTTAWASYALLKGYDAFPDAYQDLDSQDYRGTPNGIPDILDEVKTATDYLIKANPDSNTMIARIGGSQDHDYWVTSPYQSTLSVSQGGGKRPVYAGAKADICGIAAASLALMANLYQEYDSEYAESCLYHAKIIYEIGKRNPDTTSDEFYQDDTWKDGMLCGAVEIFRAGGEDIYFNDAVAYENQLGSHGWVVDWANHLDYGRHSLYKAGYTEVLTDWKRDIARYPQRVSNATYVKGLAYFLDWGSLRYATGAAFASALYYEVTGDTVYRDFARSQADYVMGINEYNRSFIVGWGENAPEHPHHANAYGREALDWNLNEDHLYSLEGAVVGGPTRKATGVSSPGYQDIITDWVGNEVTIDYNSGMVGATAMVVNEFIITNISDNQENITPDSFILGQNYPNPFNATTRIPFKLNKREKVSLSIFNLLGQKMDVIFNEVRTPGNYNITFNADKLPGGVYFYRLKTTTTVQTRKFILLR